MFAGLLFITIIPQQYAYAWTKIVNFDSGIVGQKTSGVSGFNSAGTSVLFDNTLYFEGGQSAKVTWVTGTDGFPSRMGGVTFTPVVINGGEIWARGYYYFQSPWSWTASPCKILRIHVANDNGSNVGYLSIIQQSNGKITLSNEVQAYQPESNVFFDVDSWQSLEIYVKFSTTAGIIRIWKNGILVFEDLTRRTMNASSDKSDFSYVMSYWNGGAPQNQTQYLDSFIFTTDTPTNADAAGNRMIGPRNWNKIPRSPSILPPD